MQSSQTPNSAKTSHIERKWGIREFAQMFDVTPRTIRFYEDKGLLTPSRDAGARVFGQADYLRFEKIMRGKRLGFTLDDIKEVMEVTDGHITDRVELLRRQKNFRHVIASLKRRREDIASLARDMTEICNVIDTHIEDAPDETVFLILPAPMKPNFQKRRLSKKRQMIFNPLNVTPAS